MHKRLEYHNFMEVEMRYRTQQPTIIDFNITPHFCKIKFNTNLPSNSRSPK
jgi:hypothetical protein